MIITMQTFATIQANNSTQLGELFWRLIYFIIVFAFIILIAYMVTKFIGKKSMAFTKSKNLKVIDRISLGIDKSLYIVNVGKHYYLIAAGKQNIELIDKLDKTEVEGFSDDELFHPSDYMHQKFDFYLGKYFANKKDKPTEREIEKREIPLLYEKVQALKSRYQEVKKRMSTMNRNDEK